MPSLLAAPPVTAPDVDADLTRRRLLTGAGGLALTPWLAGCADDDDPAGLSASTPSPTAAAWTFTDDRGVTVELPARPTRIAAYEIAGASLVFLGVPVAALEVDLIVALFNVDQPAVFGFDDAAAQAQAEAIAPIVASTEPRTSSRPWRAFSP